MAVAVATASCTTATPNCRFWDWGEGHVRPECCTAHLLELVDTVHALLAARGIPHWLDFGTLLGAVRDGELIPWDTDADFGIFARDAERVLELRDELEAAGHSLYTDDPAVIRVLYSDANRIALDLTLWHERDGLLASDEGPLDLWPGMHDRIAFPPELVAELSEVSLNGRTLPAPADPARLLSEHRYGPDWRTPTRPIVSLATRQVVPSTQMTASARELLPWLAERDAVLRGLMWEGRSERMRTSRAGRWLVRAGLPPDPPAPGPDATDPALSRVQSSARLDGAGDLRARASDAAPRGDALAAAGRQARAPPALEREEPALGRLSESVVRVRASRRDAGRLRPSWPRCSAGPWSTCPAHGRRCRSGSRSTGWSPQARALCSRTPSRCSSAASWR